MRLRKSPKKKEIKTNQKYAGYVGSSGIPLNEDEKYSKKRKIKKHKYQVYKIGMNPEKVKVSYHK